MTGDQPDAISRVALLDEPTRHRLYDYVVRSRTPVGRDEASEATGVLDEVGASGHTARLRPSPDNCCVVLEPAGS